MRLGRLISSPAACAAVLAAIFASVALAAKPAAAQSIVDDPAQLAIGVGEYNVLHPIYNAAIFRGEYRFGDKLFFLRPIIGGEVNTTGGAYGYGGFSIELGLGDRNQFLIIPSAAVGVWERGSGKKLGSFVEFRTGGEFDYRFENLTRLGLSFHHISNAGLTKENPGVEEALLVYTLPLGFFFP